MEKFDDLFDIAHGNALELIKIEEDKLFLINQRKKGRPGSMAHADYVLAAKEKRKTARQEKEIRAREKHNADLQCK